jgi:hypothetical protein
MKVTKKWGKTCRAGMFGIALALVPVLNACEQSVSGRFTGESEGTSVWSGGFMSFEFDGGIVKIMSGRNDKPTAVPYKINGKHISIEVPLSPLVLEIKDGNTLEGLGSPISGKRFFKSVAGFDYRETNEGGKRGITITNYTGTNSAVTIPAKIRNLPVTAIGELAFAMKQLTGVTIPEGVTTIGYYAFDGNQLTSVTIPESVTTIGEYAFYRNQLTSVTIPDSVTSIGLDAFNEDFTRYYNNNGQKGIYTLVNGGWTFKRRVKTAGDFEYEENNIDGKRGITITHYTGTNPALTIPAKINNLPVTAIGEVAFAPYVDGFGSLERFIEEAGKPPIQVTLISVTIPNSVTTIGGDAFAYNQLTSITIPNSVTTIGRNAFNGNQQLTNITIGNNVNSDYGFGGYYRFDEYYNANGKKAGTYTFADRQWNAVHK